MLIVMDHNASAAQVRAVQEAVEAMGLQAAPIPGRERTAIGVLGNQGYVDDTAIRNLPGVRECIHVSKPYKLVSRDFHPESTLVEVGAVKIGDGHPPVVIAGPCSIESPEQMVAAARIARDGGAQILRGGAFKPRTGPHSFQGLGEKGLKYLRQAGDAVGMPVVTEIMRIEQLDAVCRYADILQIGARNMQNFDLLKEVGKCRHPVLLKRGMSATLEEFLAAAEYILAEGNSRVILCERGIRTFERATRNTLDLSVVPLVRELSHLPILVDPSHATGKRSLVAVMSKAALVAGAHGIMVEVHPDPAKALCDGAQSLDGEEFREMMGDIRALLSYLGY
ncbi:3-deoxy-D-arabinoheptulosonate-7-phosphate synthase [Geoalkalibacter ferrihydriticus]|uniref:3-deoxy-7-phosphoheptulonate synthase n=2 Tax=Geoalkalibacter ferrihydriticus TaxID=392333 RepID=A0A0C2HMR4_9BACT|nr:3-deoxy-7-phosphoheptulonate synthase [Geoalkalibacter ferrihydriticus]KIH76220.1 3-deoxy-7-phosphoheptulonate synthase [Geoalkalibacter ferrihydriticus DSM 17813]SDL26637.1 3-deoxy-D-arabinoheptulosonate-7-phosphate synthase [Geoalkalibacter ferrihydriticus]